MNQLEQQTTESRTVRKILILVMVCCWILLSATIAGPEDWNGTQFGTSSILPPELLSKVKAVGRGIPLIVFGWLILSVWRLPRRIESMQKLLPVILFCMMGIVSIAWSGEPSVTLTQSVTFTIVVLLALLVSTSWRGERDTSFLLKFLSIALILGSSLLILLHFSWPSLHVLTRSSSGIFHSTNAGAMGSVAIVILLASATIWGWRWSSLLLVPGTMIHLAAMLIGSNRFSLLVLVLIGALIVLVLANRAILATVAVATSLLGVLYFCLDPQTDLIDKAIASLGDFSSQGQTRTELNSFSGRQEMWLIIWGSFIESPIVGHGYFVTSESGRLFVWGQWGNWTAHNCYLQSLATMGVCGTVLLFGGLLNIGLRLLLALNSVEPQPCELRKTAIFVLLMCVWFLIWGIFNESILGPLQPESVVFGVSLGLGSAATLGINRAEFRQLALSQEEATS